MMKTISMFCRRPAIILALALTARLALADAPAPAPSVSRPLTNVSAPALTVNLHSGPSDAPIANLTAMLLQRNHYSKRGFDDQTSADFLKEYIDTLDSQHLLFFSSDITGFSSYRFRLDDLTIGRGDTSPAYIIFNLFLHRMDQRVRYCLEFLQTNHFVFTNDVKVSFNRKDAPFPKDLAAAQNLWRERLLAEYLQEKLNKQTPDQIMETLVRRYQRILKTFNEWDSENVLEIYLNALAHVYDPHSDYMGKSVLENFAIQMNLSLFGIGAELRSEDGVCKINRLMPGPAERSKKVKVGDKIVAVAQSNAPPVDIVDMPLTKAVNLIRGPKGSEVRLTIAPADAGESGTRKVVTIIRDEIKLEDQEAKAKLVELPRDGAAPLRLGVIDLPSFYAPMDLGTANGKGEPRSTTADVAKLGKKLQQEGAQGIILDLRRNGGGSLEEAIALTGLFIKKGPVVQVRDWDGKINVSEPPQDNVAYDGPLAVLTSRFSASASEIVAAALQDHQRALIIGDRSTHGKGTVQSLNSLKNFLKPEFLGTNDPGALKLTIRKFYRPSGESTQLKGVVPDVILPSVNNVLEVGESSLDHPLPWDTIPSAPHTDLNRVAPYLEELRHRSEARIASAKDFAYVREDMGHVEKAQAEKSASLSEAVRLQEKVDADARQKARKQERAARPPTNEKVYELTLKLAGQPGLPPPVAKTNTIAAATSSPSIEVRPPKTAAVVATNSASVAKIGAPSAADDPVKSTEDEEDTTPATDHTLTEAEAVLADYIALLAKGSVATMPSPPQVR
jgi:carboxyl-terminal processing protease